MLGILMFFVALLLLMFGFPVAFTFGATSLFFGLLVGGVDLFTQMPYRIWSLMTNAPLMAVPLFIYMGIILQKSGIAEELLETMGSLFGRVKGGVAVSTILVGTLLAASTGVVGASVVAMGVISLPVMLKYKYSSQLATGVICASGTLGQIIPPSLILIILGMILQQPVGDLFKAAFLPGMILVGSYIVYTLIVANVSRHAAPLVVPSTDVLSVAQLKKVAKVLLPPLVLVVAVLGSIFFGVATPTESAAIGCCCAVFLAGLKRQRLGFFDINLLKEAGLETTKMTAMVMTILIGATFFSLVFTESGADHLVEKTLTHLPGGQIGFLLLAMLAIFILGFFIDFIEIAFIVVPILLPTAKALDIDLLWFGILIAINLQTSFLTPPFGFSLFYLRGVAPDSVKTLDIYKGVVPFIIIQFLVLLLFLFFPQWFGFL